MFYITRVAILSLAEGKTLKTDVTPWMRRNGVHGYGYLGPSHLSVAHETTDLPVCGRRDQDGVRPLLRAVGRGLRDLVLALRALPGLLVVVITLRGGKAINRYHARHRGLDTAIIVLFTLFVLALVVMVIVTIP